VSVCPTLHDSSYPNYVTTVALTTCCRKAITRCTRVVQKLGCIVLIACRISIDCSS
jgi:hypothetical protein